MQVIMPAGALGPDEYDDDLGRMIRRISVASADDPREWPEKYGANYDSDVFMMHRYCRCEKDDCPWCGGCDCPSEVIHYFVDGVQVTHDEWVSFYDREVYAPLGFKNMRDSFQTKDPAKLKKMDELAEAASKRRSVSHDDPICDYCLGKGLFALHGAEPGSGAPNFWHKPTGFKVWWYKYIGRDMKTNLPVTAELLERVERECMEEIRG